MQAADGRAYHFEGFTLDLTRGCLRRSDHEIELRPKSFEMLRHLVENAGRPVPKDELASLVWRDVVVTDESLTRCISDIRLALGDSERHLIRTVLRRGYLFVALVTSSGADRGFSLLAHSTAGHSTRSPPRLSIVVLPFLSLSDDRERQYAADVITDDLTTDLSRIPHMFVISRNTAFTYKDKPVGAKQIGRELGVLAEPRQMHVGDPLRQHHDDRVYRGPARSCQHPPK